MSHLFRDPSCMRDILWRIRLPESASLPAVIDKLEAQGWTQRSRIPAVSELEGPHGHTLVMVPRTGRVQIRIHYLTAHADRPKAAQEVCELVSALAAR